MAFLPFLFFKRGFANIPMLLTQVKNSGFSGVLGGYRGVLPKFVQEIFTNFSMGDAFIQIIAKLLRYFTLVISLFSFCLFFIKHETLSEWEKMELLMFTLMFFPSGNAAYCGLYLFSLVILYLATISERSRKHNILLLIMFIFALLPIEILPKDQSIHSLDVHKFIFLLIGCYTVFSRIKTLVISAKKVI